MKKLLLGLLLLAMPSFFWANEQVHKACRNLIVMYDECAKSSMQGVSCETAYGIVYGTFFNQFRNAQIAHNFASVCKMVCQNPQNYFANRVDIAIYEECLRMFGH